MHPILSRLRRLFWYVCAWIVPGIALALTLAELQTLALSQSLLFALPVTILYGFILASAYYVCRSLPFRERTALRILTMFGGAAIMSALIWLVLCNLWSGVVSGIVANGAAASGVLMDRQSSILFFIGAVLLYLVSLLAYDVFIAFENIRIAERQQIASQLMARDAELQMLRSQINPHFLFNSLNSISALTSIDASAARDMAIELGSFYRKTLAISARPQITLGEEIDLCKRFVAIEKIRFGEQLQVSWILESAALTAQVPAMFLQPLLENAIKHGLGNLSDGGVIEVRSFIRESSLHLVIENPVEEHLSSVQGTATGLKNLSARLHNYYQGAARVSWQQIQNRFSVEIIIPFGSAIAGSAHG